ncbi:MAG TPA: N-acetyltransferase family protein [Planctomycetota bacterium]|jgi:phosphinothricin acetyltransferase|nr:N-acetyltransferase family protein [Planctomycetota bacterium]
MTPGDKVILRAGATGDLPALVAIYNHYIAHSAATFDTEPYEVADRAAWMAQFGVSGPWRLIVAVCGEEISGYACSGPFRPKLAYRTSVETSVYLLPHRCGLGLGRRLMEALLSELESAPVHRAYALITEPNVPSEHLHATLGYRPVGRLSEAGRKFATWHSVGIWERTFAEPLAQPLSRST